MSENKAEILHIEPKENPKINPSLSKIKETEDNSASSLTENPTPVKTFEETFPQGIYSPELDENNESIIDPIKGPRNLAIKLANDYIENLTKTPKSNKLIQKLRKQVQKVMNIPAMIQKNLGSNDPMLKAIFKDDTNREEWVKNNTEHNKNSKLAYLFTLNKLINTGILKTFKEADILLKENNSDSPTMETIYTPEIMAFYQARQEELRDIQSNPFPETDEKIEETMENSRKERQELQKEIESQRTQDIQNATESPSAIGNDNSILIQNPDNNGFENTSRKGNFELAKTILEDFNPQNISQYMEDLQNGKLNLPKIKHLTDSLIRDVFENKDSSDVYKNLYYRLINLSSKLKNSQITQDQAEKSLSVYLKVLENLNQKNFNPNYENPSEKYASANSTEL